MGNAATSQASNDDVGEAYHGRTDEGESGSERQPVMDEGGEWEKDVKVREVEEKRLDAVGTERGGVARKCLVGSGGNRETPVVSLDIRVQVDVTDDEVGTEESHGYHDQLPHIHIQRNHLQPKSGHPVPHVLFHGTLMKLQLSQSQVIPLSLLQSKSEY